MTVPRAEPSQVRLVPVSRARHGTRRRPGAATEEADQNLPVIAAVSGDAMLLALLTLFNESADMDVALQESLDMLTKALGGRIGEIWLAGEEARLVPPPSSPPAALSESVPDPRSLVAS